MARRLPDRRCCIPSSTVTTLLTLNDGGARSRCGTTRASRIVRPRTGSANSPHRDGPNPCDARLTINRFRYANQGHTGGVDAIQQAIAVLRAADFNPVVIESREYGVLVSDAEPSWQIPLAS